MRNANNNHDDSWDSLGQRKHDALTALSFGSFFWPPLLLIDGFVLLAENYDPRYFRETLDRVGPTHLESTINTVYLDNYFAGSAAADEWERLGAQVCSAWKAKASAEFPGRNFVVEFSWYGAQSDPGVVLLQRPLVRG